MSQNYYISMGPMGHTTDTTCEITVLRGHAQFRIKVEIAQVKGTIFGKEPPRHINALKRRSPLERFRDKAVPNLIHQHCLPLEKLAPQTSLQDLSLEAFLYQPNYNLELTAGGINGDIQIKGKDECSYTPAFFTSPIRTADLPEPCRAVPFFQARDISIAPTLDAGRTIGSIQGRVVTADGVALYFKPRFEWRESEFESELRILSRIDEARLTVRLRVPRLQGIVVSSEKEVIGMLMTLVTSPEIGTHLRSPGLQDRSELHGKWEE